MTRKRQNSHKPLRPAPTLKKHKQSENGYARFNGRQRWFGTFDDPRTHQEFAAFVAGWEADGRKLLDEEPLEATTVRDLVARFLEHAEEHYCRKDKTPTGEAAQFGYAVRELVRLYGPELTSDFTFRKLKRVRGMMIANDLCRVTVNARIRRIKSVFAWGAEEELVPQEVSSSLHAVKVLQEGRSKAKEPEDAKPAPTWKDIEAILPDLLPTVRSMLLLQWWTGMRPGEVVAFRLRDLDTSTEGAWAYRPRHHKNTHRKKSRTVGIGPEAQVVLKPYLRRVGLDPRKPLFRAVDAVVEKRLRDRAERVVPLRADQEAARAAQKKESPGRGAGEHYTTSSYSEALRRACAAAGVPEFGGNLVRHAAGQRVELEAGIEAARRFLGHSSTYMTERYTRGESDGRVLEIAAKTG